MNHPRDPREIETRLTPEMLDDGWSAMSERAQIPCLRVAHRILGHGHALR